MSSEQNKDSGSNQSEKGGISKVIIACGAVVIVVLVVVIVILLMPKEKEKRNVVITPDNVEEAIRDMETREPVQAGYYEVKQNSTWNFKDGDSASENAYVENSTNNSNDVYFDVFVHGTEETDENAIYKSPIIPLGSSLSSISLDKHLDAGTYDCVMIYHLVDEDQNTLDTLRVSVTIVVES